ARRSARAHCLIMPSVAHRPLEASPQLIAALVTKVREHFGANYGEERGDELVQRLSTLAEERGIAQPQAWLNELASQPWNSARLRELAPAVTVGETYFRRDPKTWDWLRYRFLPPIIERRRKPGMRRLALWSAGCCTGE